MATTMNKEELAKEIEVLQGLLKLMTASNQTVCLKCHELYTDRDRYYECYCDYESTDYPYTTD